MEYREIVCERRERATWLTLNRPERLNAWTPRMAKELWHAIEAANEAPETGVVVMTGAGRGFCAGADISAFANQLDAGALDSELRTPGSWVDLCRRSKPLIAAVNGPCVGVGLTMILPFDVIIASEKAKLGMFFVRLGLVPELASTHFLVQRVGFAKASEMCLSGRAFPAAELEGSGLYNALVPAEALEERAAEMAAQIAANPEPQLRMIKQLLSENGSETDLRAVEQREFEMLHACYSTPEHKEAIQAFAESRPPRFHSAPPDKN